MADDVYPASVEQVLSAASEDVANAHIEIVQLKATIAGQMAIIDGLKRQLEEAADA